MKKIIYLITFFFSSLNAMSQEYMSLTGEGSSLKNGEKFYLISGRNIVDSTLVKDGKFAFTLQGMEPCECSLRRGCEPGSANNLLYLDYCNTHVKIGNETYQSFNNTFMNITVTGNPVHNAVQEVNDIIFKAPNNTNPFEGETLKIKLKDACERADLSSAYILGKYMSLMGRYGLMSDVKACVERMPEKIKSTVPGKIFIEEYNKYSTITTGGQVKNFTMNTPEGKSITLKEFVKGKKLVLIDFWASWCAPCRTEGKNIKSIYEDYYMKGFDVLGVSLDEKKADWLKAITEEGYKWTQVSDLKGFKSPVCKNFSITSIPALFLIDGNGNIIAVNTRGEKLRAKVAEFCE